MVGIAPTNVAFHVMYACPLSCAHCCFASSPDRSESLQVQHVKHLMSELADAKDHDDFFGKLRTIVFTGGEPFLLGKGLVELVSTATSLGFKTQVVTSGYWAKSDVGSARRLSKLKDAGLGGLTLSWDDYHAEFVDASVARRAYQAAKRGGVPVTVASVVTEDCYWTGSTINSFFSLGDGDEVRVLESELNLTGRAAEVLRGSPVRSDRYLGPCSYVITGPAVNANGNLLACCGAVPELDQLVAKRSVADVGGIAQALKDVTQSALFQWIYLKGPYDILRWMSERYGVATPSEGDVHGNCEACYILFNSEELRPLIEHAVRERASEIAGELNFLDALGWLSAEKIRQL